jgi:dihydroxyacetone kinase
MKNLMNHVDTVRDEALDGLVAAHSEILVVNGDLKLTHFCL